MKKMQEKYGVGRSSHGMDYADGSMVYAYLQSHSVYMKYVKICMTAIFQ